MPKKAVIPVIDEAQVEQIPEKPRRTRTMTPEMLEKLKHAREMALKAKKEGKRINEELGIAKKETFSEKIDQVETYHKLKAKVEDEVKKNEIVSINQRINDMHSKFDNFLQDREQDVFCSLRCAFSTLRCSLSCKKLSNLLCISFIRWLMLTISFFLTSSSTFALSLWYVST